MITSNIIKITILNHAHYMTDIALSNVNMFSIFTLITEVIFILEAKKIVSFKKAIFLLTEFLKIDT